jgi:hypothetical protein
MQKHENNSSKDWVSPAENLKSSNIQAYELWGTTFFSKHLEMKKMGVLEIEAYKYVTWRIKNNLMDC